MGGGLQSEILTIQITRSVWVIGEILYIMCSSLACLLFYNNHFIFMYTLYICISFNNFVKKGRWGNFSIKINTE